jgi:hypothetical protein
VLRAAASSKSLVRAHGCGIIAVGSPEYGERTSNGNLQTGKIWP